jgi:glycosyltransferase involved in cell wall biosynthesis
MYNWDKISLLVCCNPWIASMVAEEIKNDFTTVLCVRNSIDANLWSFKERTYGNKIGMVCRIHPVKNLPLAAQILLRLEDYELHIAGPIQDPNIATYLSFILGQRVKFYGNIERKFLDEWWEDKNYCLSTSISEGDPMALLEAMSKGIKPIVHNWPGANELYDTFSTVDEAISQIKVGYDSYKYRQMVLDNNPTGNIKFLAKLVLKGDTDGKH